MYTYIHICIHMYLHVYIYIYIYTHIHLSLSLYIYIYISHCTGDQTASPQPVPACCEARADGPAIRTATLKP